MRRACFLGLFLSVGLAGCTGGHVASSSEYAGTVTAPSYSEAQLAQMRSDELRALAEAYQIKSPPDVALLRYVTPSEWPQSQIDCLRVLGFDVEVTPDGQGVSGASIPAEQNGPYKLASYECQAKYSQDPRFAAELNQSQLKYLYWYYTQPLRECLSKEGHEIADPPSEAVFVDHQASDPWTPYREIMNSGIPFEETSKLLISCPEMPPVDRLWPGK